MARPGSPFLIISLLVGGCCVCAFVVCCVVPSVWSRCGRASGVGLLACVLASFCCFAGCCVLLLALVCVRVVELRGVGGRVASCGVWSCGVWLCCVRVRVCVVWWFPCLFAEVAFSISLSLSIVKSARPDMYSYSMQHQIHLEE